MGSKLILLILHYRKIFIYYMKALYHFFLRVILMTVILAVLSAKATAAEETLLITLDTNIYGYQGPYNYFTLYLGATADDTPFRIVTASSDETVSVSRYTLGKDPSDGSNAVIATAIPCSVTDVDATVKIYGDPSTLDYFDAHGCYLNSAIFGASLTNLSVVDLSHNELTSIDLSGLANLESIDLTDNAFADPSKMKIGTVHPSLALLSVGINDVIDPELDLRNFPNLLYFSARSNYGLTAVDPTGCPFLVSLVLEVTNVAELDVSQNPYLNVLNISNTRIKDIDLSSNPRLEEFYMSHDGTFNSTAEYKLKNIDLSHNAALKYLDLSGNMLTSVDVSHNPQLLLLYLQRNLLTEIDLSANTRLSTLNLAKNYFNFSTLPLPGIAPDYTYYQNPLPLSLKYKVGEPIDLSSQVVREPFTYSGQLITPRTYAAVFVSPRAQDPYELDASKYTFVDGVITFHEAVTDSLYMEFFCDVFEEWPLSTSTFMVKTPEAFDLPSTAFSFALPASMQGRQVSLRLGGIPTAGGYELPVDVTVIAGEENIFFPGALTQSELPAIPNITFTLPAKTTEVVVKLPDGFMASAIGMDGIDLESIDLSPADRLQVLSVTNAGLRSIDLAYNRELETLCLAGNQLTSLNLSGIRGDFEKWDLSDIDLSDNRLTRLGAVYYESIENLNLADNAFEEFDAKYYTSLRSLRLGGNALTGHFDLSQCAALTTLDLSRNSISSIELANPDRLRSINLSSNHFTLATLPFIMGEGKEYSYAPQAVMPILKAAKNINLSAQNVMVNGTGGTVYVWRYAVGNAVLPADKYTESNGNFIFDSSLTGTELYCEMTNPLFPDFDTHPLVTSAVTVAEIPTTLVASFTTTQNGNAQIGFSFHGEGDHAVYIDWRGDGSEYEPYVYEAGGSQSIYREGNCFAGATAKVYSYGSAEEIKGFFMNATLLDSLDGTPMTRVEAINIHDARLKNGSIRLPQTTTLTELILNGNSFSTETFPGLPNISSLSVANNLYRSFDLSLYPEVMFAQLADNYIEEVTFSDNEALYQLDLTGNLLTDIDLNGLTGLQELLLSDNELTEIELSPVKDRLRVLHIAGNYFTFATLPLASDMGNTFFAYDYSNQKAITPTVLDGVTVDLSEQANVAGTPTSYRWFAANYQADVYYDYYLEEFVGTELLGADASSNPDFTVEGGVTTFLRPQSTKVVCAMTNPQLPNLILYTTPLPVSVSGVETVADDVEDNCETFTLQGLKVADTDGLSPGIYIRGGRKIIIK